MDMLTLKKVYFAVFLSLVFWAIFAYITTYQHIASQDFYSNILNISGKQRMLSQKTALLAKRVYVNNNIKLKTELINSTDLMKKNHNFIINNFTSSEVESIYLDKEYNLSKKINYYFELLDEFSINMDSPILLLNIEKYSYKLLDELDYAVHQFEKESKIKTKELKIRELVIIIGILLTLISEAIFIVLPAIRYSQKKEKELYDLNMSLEKRVIVELDKNKEKDEMIHYQSKMITMREILDNIAHQWRQPLSIITTSASGIKLQKEYSELSEEDLLKNLDVIIDNCMYLSSTIDKFRGFFQQDKVTTCFSLKDIYYKSLEILAYKFDDYNIKLIPNIQDIVYSGQENDLIQVFIHILNNAKDVLKNKLNQKFLFTNIYESNNKIIIEIIDNGGGIQEEIKDKIFNPYFTTKHESQGRGIDLYISKQLIENNFKGHLSVENSTYSFDKKEQKGAKFIISLPRILD